MQHWGLNLLSEGEYLHVACLKGSGRRVHGCSLSIQCTYSVYDPCWTLSARKEYFPVFFAWKSNLGHVGDEAVSSLIGVTVEPSCIFGYCKGVQHQVSGFSLSLDILGYLL